MAQELGRGVAAKVTNKVIAYAFTAGVLVALLLGLLSKFVPPAALPYLTSALVLAGIVVGFFNIGTDEARDYVVFVTALVIVTGLSKGALGSVQIIGPTLEAVLQSIMAFVVPSVIIVAVRAIINLAKD